MFRPCSSVARPAVARLPFLYEADAPVTTSGNGDRRIARQRRPGYKPSRREYGKRKPKPAFLARVTGLRRAQAFDPLGTGRKAYQGIRLRPRDAAGGRLGATRRAALSGRQRASKRLPDVPHRAARLSYSVGRTVPRRP